MQTITWAIGTVALLAAVAAWPQSRRRRVSWRRARSWRRSRATTNSPRDRRPTPKATYFTDQPNDRILKWSVDGKITTFLQPAGRSNGLCFDSKGMLWACADEKNEMWRIAPDGKHEVILKDLEGKLLNGPNDVWLRPDGGLYFSDPYYERDYWHRGPKEYGGEDVYYLSPDHKTLKPRRRAIYNRPNGIIGTPDGKTLYVADIDGKKTCRYDIKPDGSLATRSSSASWAPTA